MAGPEIGKLKVLVVEDDLVSRTLMGGMLAKVGIDASRHKMASSLAEGAAALRQDDIDAVLLDLNLPDSRGLDTLVTIATDYPEPAIIVVTGDYDDQLGLDSLAHGAQDYMVKGKFDVYLLRKAITYAIERKNGARRQQKLLNQLENVNNELKSFAYIVSHDLKAPLRGISTLAEWLAADFGDKLGDEGKEQITLLLSRVARMHDLIEGILNYSRVGRIKEDFVDVDLNTLLREIIDTLNPPDHIKVNIAENLPTLRAEHTRILQLFQNIISNAIKYIDKPQGMIAIDFSDRKDLWEFRITDNGPGIEEKHFERIFQIFQTIAPKDNYESTGVGLSIVKKIVEMYGGTIRVESVVGEGSTFVFTISKTQKESENAQLETIASC
jgi:signal transduction histidine kinase